MDILQVLTTFYQEQEWVSKNNDYDSLYWSESNSEPKPALEELQSKWDDQSSEIDNKKIQAVRQREILSKWPIEKQFEAITELHMDRPEKMDELIAYIEQIKIDNPKS